MDSDRTHRTESTTSTSSEIFVCFTSRLSSSSSSMRLSSKTILSPGRARDPPFSLSTSLSRRLRTNGSMKGGQASPMFPTGGKKRGCAFENPEPSSPKVTCIGQVRVKTKKQGKKMRTLSKRRSGEVSFRKVEQAREGASQSQIQTQTFQQTNASNQYQQQQRECLPHRNQRWVHFPLTICEALRAFGAEFSCLFPCRSSCFSTSEREKEEKALGMGLAEENGHGQSSCGAVFARWLVALQEGEGGKGREIELVVGGDDERTELPERTLRNSRRHVFDDMEIKGEECKAKDEVVEEEEARVSICIPPKNALLLMRCRSDPTRMAALTNRFWESPVPQDDEEEQEEDDHKEDDEEDKNVLHEKDQVVEESEVKNAVEMEQQEDMKRASVEINEEQENTEGETKLELEAEGNEQEQLEEKLQIGEEPEEAEQEKQEQTEVRRAVGTENELSGSSSEAIVDQESTENEDEDRIQEKEEESRATYPSSSAESDGEEGDEHEAEPLAEAAILEEEEEGRGEEKSNAENETHERPLEDQELIVTQERSEAGPTEETHEEEEQEGSNLEEMESESHDHEEAERESHEVKKQERESYVLPDCLLLMMCEPKLSMEVSKETWVCSTDFIRRLPERQVNPKDGSDEPKRSADSNHPLPPLPLLPAHHHNHNQPLLQPPRSSCSLPAAAAAVSGMSMTTMIEQKLVNAVPCEPFVLTRCKSEPMRTAAKLAPDACFWKNRKLEPHRRATFGVGTAAVGF